jgi:hypothetical protein
VNKGTIPIAYTSSLAAEVRRTRALRLSLAIALVAAAVSVVLLARSPHAKASPFVLPGSNTIVVLDVSESVELEKVRLAYSTLTLLGRSKAKIGLVVFSSYAYEALPPGSPAATLLPIAKLFDAHEVGPARYQQFVLPPNPWKNSFSAGTEIASGLALARSLIVKDHLQRPSVVLISDLLDGSDDLGNVKIEGKAYRRLGIPVRIVGLSPKVGDLRYFLGALGSQSRSVQPKLPKQARLTPRTTFPTAFAVAAIIVVLLLAADELVCAPLRFGLSGLLPGSRS